MKKFEKVEKTGISPQNFRTLSVIIGGAQINFSIKGPAIRFGSFVVTILLIEGKTENFPVLIKLKSEPKTNIVSFAMAGVAS